jgi:hypothetical protein
LSLRRQGTYAFDAVLAANYVDATGATQAVSGVVSGVNYGNPPDFVWFHYAATYDKATGLASLFLNGRQVTETNLGSFAPVTSGDLYFGVTPLFGSPPTGPLLLGLMDEMALYKRALSAEEIGAIYRSHAGRCADAPVILAHPDSLRVNEGADAEFAVVAAGNPLLRYQWRKDGVPIPGATGDSLTLTNVQLALGGSYSVVVSNNFGMAMSSNAVLTVNRSPVADASETPTLIVHAGGECCPIGSNPNAAIVLNGSLSSDPDGDSLYYVWSLAGTPIATGMVAVVSLPPGTHVIDLVVEDGLAEDTESIAITILTPGQAVEQLIAQVDEAGVRHGRPLLASLEAALASIQRGNCEPATGQLRAFLNKVRAQVGDSVLGTELTGAADRILAALGAEAGGRLPCKIRSLKCHPDGGIRLHFSGVAGGVYLIEASTNLTDRECIGVTCPDADGQCDFADPGAGALERRYYRVVRP